MLFVLIGLQIPLHEAVQTADPQAVVLGWAEDDSPLDAWFSEFLHISQQGRQLLYQGAKAKRGEPGEEDLLLLLPGQQHTELLDLTQAYQLSAMPALVQAAQPASTSACDGPQFQCFMHQLMIFTGQ